MNNKKDFSKKSNKLIKSFEEQNRILNNLLEKLDKEYHEKFDSPNAIENINKITK